MTTTTDAPTFTGELIWLDPRTLTAHPVNIRTGRTGLGDLSDLAASIASVGVLQPIVIVGDDAGYRIIAGHRRAAAAIQADQQQVPCLIRPDLTEVRDQLVGMLVENTRRADLTPIEEARGYHQLTLAGVTQKEITRLTGAKTAHIRRSVAVARNQVAAETAETHGLSLDQAVELAELADDPQAVELLKAVAEHEPQRWEHTVARIRQDRREEAERAAAIARLAEAGITAMDDDDLPESAMALRTLRGEDGRPLDLEAHQACPGHVVTLTYWDHQPRTAYCLDPATHGHHTPEANPAATEVDQTQANEQTRAERRAVIQGNKAWRAAREVRHNFLKALITRKTPPKGTLRFVTEWIMATPNLSAGDEQAVTALLVPAPTPASPSWGRAAGPHAAAQATDNRLPLILLAQVAAEAETRCHDHAWRNPRPADAARWLSWLASIGYTLSDIETQVIEDGTKPDPTATRSAEQNPDQAAANG
jgi:ParB family chromosome partitioning protein